MKKFAFMLFWGMMILLMTGCGSIGGFQSVKQTIVGENYKMAGEIVGEAGFYAYEYLKGDKKYAGYCDQLEKVYAQIENGELNAEGIGIINEVATLVAEEALKAKYDQAEVFLIIRAVKVAGAIADRGMSSRIDKASADAFFEGFLTGVAKAKGQWVEPPVQPEDEPFVCPDGNCKIDGLRYKNDVEYQKALAKKLKKYADKKEVLINDKPVTDYDNLEHQIERCEQLESYKVEKTWVVVDSFTIKDGKLAAITFMVLRDGDTWVEINCVGCELLWETVQDTK